ncbi:glycosyltransferase family 4 protein [Microterricola viridarii]|uniref:Glycosyltransferase involved in cell wall bisynthesis n=1 Tax=Microterricola viridarii TaxID=412690 RepID=A0A1H1QYI3_9MICO|nr:glycosyltransferase family 4 protein [Microterricola viridarii]SDS28335.1 Glycosyltransferase involved in cell wall bisynthesis [Microterricola viridarii]
MPLETDTPQKTAALNKVLVITPDSLGVQMAGPAIRAFEMAKALSAVADVRLVSTLQSELQHPDFPVFFASSDELRAHADWSDVIVFQGHVLASFPWLSDERYILVADIYDPMHLEVLEQVKALPEADRLHVSLQTAEVLNAQIERSDYMLCASEKQRDFWLGQLAALCRINPYTYDQDASLRSLLGVAPFGIEDTAPVQVRHGIKGTVPGISESDTVIIWGGGIYNWFDPITLIHAVHALSKTHPDLRLFFLGVKHPNPNVPEMEVSLRTRELAESLGLLDRVVFFNDGWVPYDERANYLLDADLGVSTHFDHLETAFSFRTRILDYLWASLPIVSTDGDTFASIIRDNDLGRVVPPEDIEALRGALEELLYDDERRAVVRENVQRYAQRLRWSTVLEPLIAFCLNPRRAPDIVAGVVSPRQRERKDLATRIAGLEASSSWRVTRPIRWASNRLSRLGRG